MPARRKLAPEQISRIRTEKRPDSLWARIFRVSVTTVRRARVGECYKWHATPVDAERRRECAP